VLDDSDDIDRKLDRLSTERSIEYELESLRAEMDDRELTAEAAK